MVTNYGEGLGASEVLSLQKGGGGGERSFSHAEGREQKAQKVFPCLNRGGGGMQKVSLQRSSHFVAPDHLNY